MGAKEQAIELADEFAARTRVPAFKAILRKRVAEQLTNRIYNPMFINQGSAGLCVPASITYGLAMSKPLDYAQAVTSLYDFGYALVGKLTLKPCDDLVKAASPGGVPEADWIMLASIRDSENWFFDYASDKDKGGTSTSETVDILQKAGYKEIIEKTMPWSWNKESNLKEALDYYKKDYQVMWRICASMIDSGITDSPEPDHRIVLAGEFTIPPNKDAPIKVPIYTWGDRITLPRTGGLKYGQFLDHYFGYIAAKF